MTQELTNLFRAPMAVAIGLALLLTGCAADLTDFSYPSTATPRQVEVIHTGMEVWGDTGIQVTPGGPGPSKIEFRSPGYFGGSAQSFRAVYGTYWIIKLNPTRWESCVAETVAAHEAGHVLGYQDDDDPAYPKSIMFVPVNECLNVRRLPWD